jgi:hypothetical protein
MGRLFGAWRYYLVCALVTGLGGVLAVQIALVTHYNDHPDEYIHVDAFCYFESHAWLPPLDLNGLNYGPEGESRVYDAEVVYWVYGRAAAMLGWFRDRLASPGAPAQPPGPVAELSPQQFLPVVVQAEITVGPQQLQCLSHYAVYRLFNVALFLITLGLLFGVGVRHAWAAAIGMVLLCLPQVIYLYAYANSDAWALSFALFLLVFALAERHPLASLSKAVLLGLLTGIVLLSKQSVWAAIPFAYTLIAYRVVQDWRGAGGARPQAVWRHGAAVLATAMLVIAPIRIWYPLSLGGHLETRLAQIREERAIPGFKPSDPFTPGRQLRSKGVGLDQIVLNLHWVETSAMSFYGYFGPIMYRAPLSAYLIALALAIINALLSLTVLRRNWKVLPDTLRLAFLSAPVVVGVCVAASMYNSWTHDYQPQGRYLFVAVVPIALWMWGTLPWESPRTRAVRLGSAALLLALCAFVLWQIVLQNPAFRI